MPRSHCFVLLMSLAVAGGCATSLSTFQPAHVAAKGRVEVESGMDLALPTNTVGAVIDVGRTLSKESKDRVLTDAEKQDLFAAGVNLALDAPAPVMHAGIAYGIAGAWEVGVRYTSGAWRLGGRRQILHQETSGFDLSAGIGIQRFVYAYPVGDVLDFLKIEDFTRWNVDVPILFGKRGSWYRLWGGPRLVFSRYQTSLTFASPMGGAEIVTASAEGRAALLGVQGGVAIGYRWLFVGFELTVVRMLSTAHLVARTPGAAEQRADIDLGTFVIYPGLALMGEF